MTNVLMVGPCSKTRGGISSVISAYKKSSLWKDFNIFWIETHYDKNLFSKIIFFIISFFVFLLKVKKSDIIHIHLSEPVSAIRKLFYFLIGKLFFKPILIHLHSFDINTSVGSNFKFIYKFLFKNSTRVIVLSPFWANEVNKHIQNCNIEIVFNPSFMTGNRKIKKEKRILFAGALNDRKGYTVLIKSFALIAKKYSDWKLVFAGNGEIEKAKQLAKDLLIYNQVEFLGWISGSEKDNMFSKAMIFCLPSNAEGFPMAILEAFSYALPVVSTKCGRIDLVLNDLENILFFEMKNHNQLARKLEILMSDKELRKKIGENAYEFSKMNFDIEVVVGKIKNIYNKIKK